MWFFSPICCSQTLPRRLWLWQGRAGHSPLFPTAGSPANWHFSWCHPVATVAWCHQHPPDEHQRQYQPPPMNTRWILGWRHKDKAFDGVKKLVLTQWNQQQCLSVDVILKTTACVTPLVPGTPRPQCPGQAGPGHCICSSRVEVWTMPGRAPRLRAHSVLPSSRGATQGDICTKWQKQNSLSSCAPHAITTDKWSPSPTPPFQVKPYTRLIAQDLCDDGLSINRHLTGPSCNWEPLFSQSV